MISTKKLTCTLLLAFLLQGISAQEVEWQKTFGGSSSDAMYSIRQTIDGGYICGGYSMSDISAHKSENSLGESDFWVLKLDAAGNIQWENTIGGSEQEAINDIRQTTDGGYILGGSSRSPVSGDKTQPCRGYYDYWIVKLDSAGNLQWQKTIGGNDNDELSSIAQTVDDGYICGGSSQSYASGEKSENSMGDLDYWVVKLNASGNIEWQNTIGGPFRDMLHSIEQTTDGGYICGGRSESPLSGDKTENTHGSYDYWIIKLDGSGNIQWQNTIGGSYGDELYTIKQTFDGGFICGGISSSDISGDKTESSVGFGDYWIVKLDSTGNILWQNTIGGTQTDWFKELDITPDGGYVCGGLARSPLSGDKTEKTVGYSDFWIVKLDSIGNIQWQNTIGGDETDDLFTIQYTSDGGIICGGRSFSNISRDKTENNLGSDDFWIVKLTGNYNILNGKVFADIDSSGSQTSGEPPLALHQIFELNSGRIAFSEQSGIYNLAVVDTGIFSVVADNLNYYISAPLMHNAYFDAFQQIDPLNDFAFQPSGVFNDLCITITPTGPFRAGFNGSYLLNFKNQGTTTINNITVVFLADSSINYFSSNTVPFLIATDSIVWNVGTLSPFQTGSILVTVNINSGIPIGTVINSGARILPVAGDANFTCNTSYLELLTTGAIDPNDILVNRAVLFSSEILNPPYLDYIIRFQNTGNDTAFNVKILNPLDTTKLQLNTLEFVASSHPVDMSFIYHEQNIQFLFNNILLPDSNTNELLSHGFIRYRIIPKSNMMIGDSIRNYAAIYFDYNFPLLTNTAITEIILFTSLQETAQGKLQVYPNPTYGPFTITLDNLDLRYTKIELYNIYGQLLRVLDEGQGNSDLEKTFDLSGFISGNYILKCGSQTFRIVKI